MKKKNVGKSLRELGAIVIQEEDATEKNMETHIPADKPNYSFNKGHGVKITFVKMNKNCTLVSLII